MKISTVLKIGISGKIRTLSARSALENSQYKDEVARKKDGKMRKEPWDSSTEKAKSLKISDFGTPEEVREMAQMPLTAVSFLEVRNILTSLVDKPMAGKAGLYATISKKSIKEILSGEAAGKSLNLEAHLKAAANIEKLYSNAIEKWEFELDPHKNNDSLEDRKYLYSPMEYDSRIVPVKLTVMKYKDIKAEKRLYSIQAINVVLE